MEENRQQQSIIVACGEEPLKVLLVHLCAATGAHVESVGSHKSLLHKALHHHYNLVITRFTEPLLAEPRQVVALRGKHRRTRLYVIADTLSAEASVALLERGVNQLFTLPISTTRIVKKLKNES